MRPRDTLLWIKVMHSALFVSCRRNHDVPWRKQKELKILSHFSPLIVKVLYTTFSSHVFELRDPCSTTGPAPPLPSISTTVEMEAITTTTITPQIWQADWLRNFFFWKYYESRINFVCSKLFLYICFSIYNIYMCVCVRCTYRVQNIWW